MVALVWGMRARVVQLGWLKLVQVSNFVGLLNAGVFQLNKIFPFFSRSICMMIGGMVTAMGVGATTVLVLVPAVATVLVAAAGAVVPESFADNAAPLAKIPAAVAKTPNALFM